MKPPIIQPIRFTDVKGLPKVHSDARRTIYEKTITTKDGILRTSRSAVTADEVILGNHYHDFQQHFRGRGGGVLYTAPKDQPTDVTAQALPENGWQFTIPAGMIMALLLKKGAVQIFVSDRAYQEGVTTHRVIIV